MTVSVRPWEEISADLRRWNMVLTREAADWGDALVAKLSSQDDELDEVRSLALDRLIRLKYLDGVLPDCPRCGRTGVINKDYWSEDADDCSDCAGTGRGTVAQMTATWQAVHGGTLYDHMVTENQADRFITGWFAAYDHLRSVRPPSPKEGPLSGLRRTEAADGGR